MTDLMLFPEARSEAAALDRRSGIDRRERIQRRSPNFAEIVTPWQIPEPEPTDREQTDVAVTAETFTEARLVDLLGW